MWVDLDFEWKLFTAPYFLSLTSNVLFMAQLTIVHGRGRGVDIIIKSIQGPDIKPSYLYFYESLHFAQVLKVLSIMGRRDGSERYEPTRRLVLTLC
jgi:hypothetical protein